MNMKSTFRPMTRDEEAEAESWRTLYRPAVEAFMAGVQPVASHTHGDYTASLMAYRTGGGRYRSYIFSRAGMSLVAPTGFWMNMWDPDLLEICGLSKTQYEKLPLKDRMAADAKVQAVKYVATEFEMLRDAYWGRPARAKRPGQPRRSRVRRTQSRRATRK